MSDTCGPMYEMPLAQYDPGEQCWKTSEATSLWALPMSSLTLPAWGSLRDGALFEQPTPVRLTTGHDFSSLPTPVADHSRGLAQSGTDFQSLPNVAMGLMPTPKAADGERGRDLPRLRPDTCSRELSTTVGHLMPTPTAQAAKHTLDDRGPGTPDDANLWSVAGRLLPTPAVNDMGAGKDPQAWKEWAARQKAADGRPAPHGKSLEQEALKMLPTPQAGDANTGMDLAFPRHFKPSPYKELPRLLALGLNGENTPPQLQNGNTSLVDEHQPPLFTETTATD